MINGQKVNNAKDFGQALRRRRKEKHYTQQDIAEAACVSTSFISDLENGKPTCELEKAIYIANMLGIDTILHPRGEN
ncbi:MAG: helix-turn-helix domain-containing protein [Solobacterium sp.]|nr:helix-turn-helix domain-containing protein [Solobacterium sp.]MCH4048801.1 helix-turn-helix domain-containing protein [Solobacterium sp.]MCH4074445.1 helix-turn-helix domain-containing protein [Solobacterium sp.]MCI1314043.1 helix-turn-helix domain-containing protein [Solobacterium sp.]MCI1346127.1 helix-turn-helix domain-containing protein [Solobacterium sp.]